MPDLKSLNNVYLFLGFLVPGLIVLWVRAQFLTGRNAPHSEAILSYLTVSVIYYALALPAVDFVLTLRDPGYTKSLAWFALVFVGPAVLGLVLGLNAQQGSVRRLLQRFGLKPVHVMPTAWDWKFGDMGAQWVLVTLKDGTRFAGFCGLRSFMSSDPKERDLYIERIYDVADDDTWNSRGENGVLIAAGEIRTIEFWPATEGTMK